MAGDPGHAPPPGVILPRVSALAARTRAPRYLAADSTVVVGGLLLGLVALIGVHFALYDTYWDYSEGVYALSAYQWLHGASLYTGMAGAQPPGVYLVGAGLLAIHGTVEWLRFAVGCFQLVAGLLASQLVWRMTSNRAAAMLTVPLVLLTPWAVHEHGALTPELVALPLLLGAAVAAASERTTLLGVLCGVLPLVKYPFAIPAAALIVVSPQPFRSLRWALGTLAVGLGITFALAGESFWRDTVTAQTQTGSRSLGELKGYWGQVGWNVLGLLVCSAVAIRLRRLASDPRTFRVALVFAGAMIVTFLTNFKEGTGLNVAVPVEAALVPLAIAGTVWALDRSRWLVVLCGLGLVFTLAQSASLMLNPQHSVPFLRAGSRPAWAVVMTGPQFRAAVAAARSCPAGVPYSGPPLLAFAARRPMPAGQPDQFIIAHAPVLAPLAARAAAVKHLCP